MVPRIELLRVGVLGMHSPRGMGAGAPDIIRVFGASAKLSPLRTHDLVYEMTHGRSRPNKTRNTSRHTSASNSVWFSKANNARMVSCLRESTNYRQRTDRLDSRDTCCRARGLVLQHSPPPSSGTHPPLHTYLRGHPITWPQNTHFAGAGRGFSRAGRIVQGASEGRRVARCFGVVGMGPGGVIIGDGCWSGRGGGRGGGGVEGWSS
ncbi:hypothetical protein BJ546DRAFT_191378 [Cryomyces antarcticus]